MKVDAVPILVATSEEIVLEVEAEIVAQLKGTHMLCYLETLGVVANLTCSHVVTSFAWYSSFHCPSSSGVG